MTAGRLVLPALRWRPESGFAHEDAIIDASLELGVGGFIVFGVGGGRADEIGRLTEELRRRAGRALLIGADLERGAGQQARRLTEVPPPAALASLQDPEVVAWAGTTTAREARSIGINWVFAPNADLDVEPANPIVQTRSFGSDAGAVAAAVTTWIGAAQKEGVLACAKHYPGHGRTRIDSHQALPSVSISLEELETSDLRPFISAIQAGVASVMTAHVAYPAWDVSGLPATRSPVILGHLRQSLGFAGIIVTDALIMEGARAGQGEEAAVIGALEAGCDLLLYPANAAAVVAALNRGADRSTSVARRIAESVERYQQALGRAGATPGPNPEPSGSDASAVAARLLQRGFVRGSAPDLTGGVRFEVVDDDLGGWYAPGPNDLVIRSLAHRRRFEQASGKLILLVFTEPRAAKGRAGLGAESLERLEAMVGEASLVVLFGHPRLAAEIPGTCPILCAWHRQPLMQEAVASWIDQVAA